MGTITLFLIVLGSIIGLMLLGYAAYSSVIFVPQSMKYTLEYLGRYTRTLDAGIYVVIPFLNQISNKISMKEEVLDIPSQTVITKDNAMIEVDGVVFHKVFDPEKATYQIDNLHEAIKQLTLTNIRSVMGSMPLDNILSDRDKINDNLLKEVDDATDPWGIKITRVEIKDIKPPQNLVDAMAQQMIAERNKRAQILDSEGAKQAEVAKAEGHKRALILGAEGEREAMVARAKGERDAQIQLAEGAKKSAILNAESEIEIARYDADARRMLAAAEAEATRLLSKELAKGDVQAINYFLGLKYVEALKEIGQSKNQKLVLMPYEATNILSSIAGMGDIFKEVMQDKSEANNQVAQTKSKSQPKPQTKSQPESDN
ncbi:SPFH domain-containing protein [Candidatus Albibeggiatoa sp. nov. NOAA]|uniref:SPFH domain-containing protein n=1 Tax=Candidatus Albibeggiatoa sp. nov. NOAA TaxID=3162724 RepID=UPI0032F23A02|nr:SPFH/Band 7/PHB domain protein [Thiotrichaceae bacterium]